MLPEFLSPVVSFAGFLLIIFLLVLVGYIYDWALDLIARVFDRGRKDS